MIRDGNRELGEGSYSIIGEEHGHGGGHEAVENRDKDDGTRDANGDVTGGVLDLLRHGGHGIVADVAEVDHGRAIEEPWDTVGEEPARVLFWVPWVREILRIPSPESHENNKQDEGQVDRRQHQV